MVIALSPTVIENRMTNMWNETKPKLREVNYKGWLKN